MNLSTAPVVDFATKDIIAVTEAKELCDDPDCWGTKLPFSQKVGQHLHPTHAWVMSQGFHGGYAYALKCFAGQLKKQGFELTGPIEDLDLEPSEYS